MSNEVLVNLQQFFEEKQLAEREYTVFHNGVHFIDSPFVIDLILNHCSPEEQRNVRDILFRIDFQNGDVHHFLEHLATGYVKTHF